MFVCFSVVCVRVCVCVFGVLSLFTEKPVSSAVLVFTQSTAPRLLCRDFQNFLWALRLSFDTAFDRFHVIVEGKLLK